MTGELFHITGINTAENNLDEYNYVHFICECTLSDEAIRVPRPTDKTGWVYCTCPRCGAELGGFFKSKKLLDAEKDSCANFDQLIEMENKMNDYIRRADVQPVRHDPCGKE